MVKPKLQELQPNLMQESGSYLEPPSPQLQQLFREAHHRLPNDAELPYVDLESVVMFWIADQLHLKQQLPYSAVELRKRLARGGVEAAEVLSLVRIASRATRMRLVIGRDGRLRQAE